MAGEAGQVRPLLPVASVVIIVDPMSQGPACRRALAGDDHAVAVQVRFDAGGKDENISQGVLQAGLADGHDRDRDRVELVFGRDRERDAGRAPPRLDFGRRPPFADRLAVAAPDRDDVVLT